ncbi:MAG: hypothetical protein M3081_18010 [Gemmatimonadota bacterium]|nr:hypothetical protein [Gemmatimonadota bacterium]
MTVPIPTPKRLLSLILPILAAMTLLLALYQFFGAYLALRARAWPFAAFYALFGFAGIVLTRALWTSRKLFRARV